MAVNIGKLTIKAQIDREDFEKDVNEMLEGMALDRMFSFGDSFSQLHDELAIVIDDMANLENASNAMVIGVSASFQALTGSLNSVGIAWAEMLLVGEMSWSSFETAMKQMLAAELAAISASALVNALYATAKGLILLATFQPTQAALAFSAAAAFAVVAAVAGIGAALVVSNISSPGGGGAGYGPLGPGQTTPLQDQNQRRYLHLEIHGNLIGQEDYVRGELIPEINRQIMENDVVVLSTATVAQGSVSGIST